MLNTAVFAPHKAEREKKHKSDCSSLQPIIILLAYIKKQNQENKKRYRAFIKLHLLCFATLRSGNVTYCTTSRLEKASCSWDKQPNRCRGREKAATHNYTSHTCNWETGSNNWETAAVYSSFSSPGRHSNREQARVTMAI